MASNSKQQSNPYSTGSGGALFENNVQTAFTVLMLTNGFAPCLPHWPIVKIKLQGKHAGFETDDFIIFVQNSSGQQAKLLAQIKHSLSITENDSTFQEVIQAAWNDYNNSKIFLKGNDAIALITGPLSATDIENTRFLLEWARSMESAEEFLDNVGKAHFSNTAKQQKLQAFQTQLKNANNGQDVSDQEVWEFLQSFHLLGYDLDIKSGVHLSLLHSLIDKDAPGQAKAFWALVKEELQYANQSAGTVTKKTFSEDIHALLKKQEIKSIPATLLRTDTGVAQPYPSEFITALLIGQWNETNDNDRHIIEKLSKLDFDGWNGKIRMLHSIAGSPLKLTNGRWYVENRLELLKEIAPTIYDEHMDLFEQCAIAVLSEKDPQFDLEPNDRYASAIYGKQLVYSQNIRKGIVEMLAIIGNHAKLLSNCSQFKVEHTVYATLQKILNTSDWIAWASLNDYFPLLAEASPDAFLKAIEEVLVEDKSPFEALFAQEGDGIMGGNYMTGVLWALEGLAWEEEYLGRASLILADLASRDPGGRWANRPINSLTTIFLPWIPQTLAPIEKRFSAVLALKRDFPNIVWNLANSMLPSSHQISSGSHKPKWRKEIPEDHAEVNQSEYWKQVNFYGSITIDMAIQELHYLLKISEHIDQLPRESLGRLLAYLNDVQVDDFDPEDAYHMWVRLAEVIRKHRYYAEHDWAMDTALVDEIDKVSSKFAPEDPMLKYRALFDNGDHDFYSDESYEIQTQKMREKRIAAIEEIYSLGNLDRVITFAHDVQSPFDIGFALVSTTTPQNEERIIPSMLGRDNTVLNQLSRGFVRGSFFKGGWTWVETKDMQRWSSEEKIQFLICLPFELQTWQKAEIELGTDENQYWNSVDVNPWEPDSNIEYAIDKLLMYQLPDKALFCVYTQENSDQFDTLRAINVLMALLSGDKIKNIDIYKIKKVIAKLQNDPHADQDALFQIEWNYLPLLDGHYGASPKLLQNRLSTHPEFFCEVIQKIYRSKHEDNKSDEPTELEKNIARNAYDLLSKWRMVPGAQENGSFEPSLFKSWIDEVKRSTKESGHFKISMVKIGNVLVHSPADPNGLWIHSVIAEELNGKDVESMREGYSTGTFNARGVHTIDPTGAPEIELSEKYLSQAEAAEAAGFIRLAATLKDLAKDYERNAERIRARHIQEDN